MLRYINIWVPLILLSFSSIEVKAQENYFRCDTIKYKNRLLDFKFPVFSSIKDTMAVQKINTYLQLSELGLLKGHERNNVFEGVDSNDGSLYGGKIHTQVMVESNNKRTVSIRLYEEASGMTMHYWFNNYTFNSGNGDLILLKDLFTDEGYSSFKKIALAVRTKELKEQFKNDTNAQKNLSFLFDGNEINMSDFYLRDTVICIDATNEMGKDNFAVYGPVVTSISLKEYKAFLSDYGKAIFSLSPNDIGQYYSQAITQVYTGMVNETNPIILCITRCIRIVEDSAQYSLTGVYAYEKYGKGIWLEGEMLSDGMLYLKEGDDEATIGGQWSGNQIVGTWTDNKSKKAYKLLVKKI